MLPEILLNIRLDIDVDIVAVGEEEEVGASGSVDIFGPSEIEWHLQTSLLPALMTISLC